MLQDGYNMKYFDFHAILIQKVYLGYMSRKYIHSYYHRKKHLENIEQKDLKVKEMMKSYHEEQSKMLQVLKLLHRLKDSSSRG